jgi:hypothetical protein
MGANGHLQAGRQHATQCQIAQRKKGNPGMKTPTPLPTRRYRRRASLMAALTGITLALGLFTGAGTASASSNPCGSVPDCLLDIGETQLSSGFCTLGGGWGGTIFCNTAVIYVMPSGYEEAFAIGTNHAAYTRWTSSSGMNSWESMGGTCEPTSYGNTSIGIPDYSGWDWVIQCIGTNGSPYFRTRTGTSSGSWTGWQTSYSL